MTHSFYKLWKRSPHVKAFETNERLTSHNTGINNICSMARGTQKRGCHLAAPPLLQSAIKKKTYIL